MELEYKKVRFFTCPKTFSCRLNLASPSMMMIRRRTMRKRGRRKRRRKRSESRRKGGRG